MERLELENYIGRVMVTLQPAFAFKRAGVVIVREDLLWVPTEADDGGVIMKSTSNEFSFKLFWSEIEKVAFLAGDRQRMRWKLSAAPTQEGKEFSMCGVNYYRLSFNECNTSEHKTAAQ